MNARCSPEWILAVQSSDQLADVFRNARSPGLAVTDLPGPEQAESFAVPGDHGFRFDHDEGGPPAEPKPGQPSPEKPISGSDSRPRPRALEDTELVTEGEVLQMESGSGFERRGGGDAQYTERVESQMKDVAKEAQAPCSHSVRGFR